MAKVGYRRCSSTARLGSLAHMVDGSAHAGKACMAETTLGFGNKNGTIANTGAWFLAVSKEKNLKYHHTIDRDGYNVGRDLLVAAAERGGKWNNVYYKADVEWVDDLVEAGRHGINHDIAIDGRTAVF